MAGMICYRLDSTVDKNLYILGNESQVKKILYGDSIQINRIYYIPDSVMRKLFYSQ